MLRYVIVLQVTVLTVAASVPVAQPAPGHMPCLAAAGREGAVLSVYGLTTSMLIGKLLSRMRLTNTSILATGLLARHR